MDTLCYIIKIGTNLARNKQFYLTKFLSYVFKDPLDVPVHTIKNKVYKMDNSTTV